MRSREKAWMTLRFQIEGFSDREVAVGYQAGVGGSGDGAQDLCGTCRDEATGRGNEVESRGRRRGMRKA